MKKNKIERPGYGRILDAWSPPDDAGEPIGCVATSFTFRAAFFEEECLGRFLQLETDAVEDGAAYLIEREEKLSQVFCAALVDQRHARGVRNLRWDLLAARLPSPAILHAKLSLLLWTRHARLIVASANLTDDGYRRNHEVFGVLDYRPGADTWLAPLDDIIEFLGQAASFARSGDDPGPAVTRWNSFLDRARAMTRPWGAADAPRALSHPRVFAVLSGPNRPSAIETLRERWPDGSPPSRAWVLSPFFDPPDAPNEPARQIWSLLKQRGDATVEYNVTVEEVPGEQTWLVHAPESIRRATPAHRPQAQTRVARLKLDDGRPLHAKCLWLENDRAVLHCAGSSNFTSAGLGLSATPNLEANLAFTVSHAQNRDAAKPLLNAWPQAEEIPDHVQLRWQPRRDDADDGATGALLPAAFGEALFTFDQTAGARVSLTFTGEPPRDWEIFAENENVCFFSERAWSEAGKPFLVDLRWPHERPPSGFTVKWPNATSAAWWPVNVTSQDALLPPAELRDLPLEVLIEILTSAQPLHRALGRWLDRKKKRAGADTEIALDPHQRVDISTFLLQRTRRVSWALRALRERLERPAGSEASLAWRLHGPVGVEALAKAIAREAKSEAERCFLLTELCLELSRVRIAAEFGVPAATVRTALRTIISTVRAQIPADALAAEPALARYASNVFEEVLS